MPIITYEMNDLHKILTQVLDFHLLLEWLCFDVVYLVIWKLVLIIYLLEFSQIMSNCYTS
jgi:hypothetical protein